MSWSQTLLLVGICLVIAGAIAVLAIRGNPRCVEAIERLRQRRILRRLKRRLPKQLKKEKERLCALWSGNPAAQCATIFNRFNAPEEKADSAEELADRTDRAIAAAFSLFEQDFLTRYADNYRKRLVVKTTDVARDLAGQYPEHANLILQRLTENDTQVSRRLDEAIRDALSQGEEDQELIRAKLNELMENSARFRRVINPGIVQRHTADLVGVAVDAVLEHFGTSWLTGMRGGMLARRICKGWRSKADQEIGDSFCKILMVDLPIAAKRMDSIVGESLSAALDGYIEHKLKHQRAVLDVLLELSHAKRDVKSGISWFRNAIAPDSDETSRSWSPSAAALVVAIVISSACVFWFYSPLGKQKAGEKNEASADTGELAVPGARTSPDIGNSKSFDQAAATPAATVTPAIMNVGDRSSEQAAAAEQNTPVVGQRSRQPPRRRSSPPDNYPLAQRTDKPGFYYSPYTRRIYDLRRVREGGLVRDPDTGQLFRRPPSK